MGKKAIVVLLVGLALASVHLAEAQQQAKMPKIGWLGARSASAPRARGIRREFRALGYVEGKNIAFEYRYADDKLDRLPALADELVRLKVDVIVAPSTPAALAAKNATRTIPIVFYSVGDPVAAGLVDSLARPGGNITGFTYIAGGVGWQTTGVTQGNHSQALPRGRAVESTGFRLCANMERKPIPARELGLQLHSMEVSSADKYEDAFTEATKAA